jgi:drug/metabolite transporter superfamily protein YnfA
MTEIIEAQEPLAESTERHFEDLTLAEALSQFWHAPRSTVQALRAVVTTSREGQVRATDFVPRLPQVMTRERRSKLNTDQRQALQLGLRLTAFILAWWGAGILANSPQRTEAVALAAGAPFLLLGFLMWLVSEWYGDWPRIRQWWQQHTQPTSTDDVLPEPQPLQPQPKMWSGLHPMPALAALVALFLSVLTLPLTANNRFTVPGFITWFLSIGLWYVALGGTLSAERILAWLAARRRWNWRSGTVLALLAILLLGGAFRLMDLSSVPPEMTSDHVEKILDANRVLRGDWNVFFPNNGGREPFQMYALALFSQLPGLGLNYTTLKLLSVIEGLLAILLMYWMGREIIGTRSGQMGNLVGLILAALVAASYWHTLLSRMGLRIILTTAVTAALLVFLARAMRYNRREDFLKAGLVLGFGLYMYQAVRMLPVVIVVGIILAAIFQARSWRARARYLLNFGALVWISIMVFVPMLGYSLQHPEDFWRRTSGRLLGDAVISTTDASGNLITIETPLAQRLEAFRQNIPILTNNLRNALLMFNWKGDVAWINGAPNQPTLDTFSGALLIVGLAAWLGRMLRRRDMFDWLVPLALVIMLLPSALSIAYPVENPSHTRTSGALPEVYLIAALPLALIVQSVVRLLSGWRGRLIAVAGAAALVLGSYVLNTNTYFVEHVRAYVNASLPYSEAGRLIRGFAESDGAYGNAFMIAYPYWWDHRALGIEAGELDWPNGIVSLSDTKNFMLAAYARDNQFRFDPELDILFLYAAEDEETQAWLEANFPEGRATLRQSYQPDEQFMFYRVPALGTEAFEAWLRAG